MTPNDGAAQAEERERMFQEDVESKLLQEDDKRRRERLVLLRQLVRAHRAPAAWLAAWLNHRLCLPAVQR